MLEVARIYWCFQAPRSRLLLRQLILKIAYYWVKGPTEVNPQELTPLICEFVFVRYVPSPVPIPPRPIDSRIQVPSELYTVDNEKKGKTSVEEDPVPEKSLRLNPRNMIPVRGPAAATPQIIVLLEPVDANPPAVIPPGACPSLS